MKTKPTLRSLLVIASSSLLAVSTLHAATYYWDQNGTTAGFGTAGGTWDTTGSSTWNATAGGDVGPIVSTTTTTADVINFGNGGTGLAAGTIAVSGTVEAGDMTFASGSGAIVLSGGTINLAAAQTTTVNNTTNRIDSVIAGAATSFTKVGTGTLILNGVNTFTGETFINSGTLQIGMNNVANGAQLGGGTYSGKITIAGGAALSVQTNANQTLSGIISGDGNLTKSYTGKLTLSGNNTYTGKTSISPTNANGGRQYAGILEVFSLNSVVGGTAFSSLGAPTTVANGTIDLGSNIQSGATLRYIGTGETTDRVINIIYGGNTSREVDASGAGLLRFTSAFTSSGAANGSLVLTGTGSGQIDQNFNLTVPTLSKQGTGNWTLAGTGNTFTGTIQLGTTTSSAGTLSYASAAGTNPITFNQTSGSATLSYTGESALTMSGLVSATALTYGTITLDASGTNSSATINYSNTSSLSTASGGSNFRNIIFSGTNTGDNTFAGAVAGNTGGGSIRKDGTGKWVITGNSTITGATFINDGTLSVSSIQNKTVAGPMGAGNSFALGNANTSGTLLYTGAAHSSDRNVRVGGSTAGTGGGSILNNGAGALTFTAGLFNNQATGITDTRALTLGGTYTAGVNEVQGEIRDNVASTAKVNLEKTGASTWQLSGANSYTGSTTVTGGRLTIASTGAINSTSGVSVAGGEFNYNNSATALSQGVSFSGTGGTLSGTGTLTPAVTITSGNRQTAGSSVTALNTTASVGRETFTNGITYNQGSIFEWNLNADNVVGLGTRGTDYDAINAGALATTGTKATFRVILNGSQNFSETFWNTDRTWSNIFTALDGTTAYNIANIFNSNVEYYNSAGPVTNGNTRTFTITGSTLNWTAVPEPTSALAGLLLGAGLLRRRRRA